MAKIIVSLYSGFYVNLNWQVAGYYEGFINTLTAMGNDVLAIISNDFLYPEWNGENDLKPGIDENKLKNKIQAFSPDLIIAFNNATLKNMSKWVDCPFVLWDADSLVYFCDKEGIKKNKDRFLYFSYSEFGYQEYLTQIQPKKENVHIVKSATAVKHQKIEQPNNISFIGSYFDSSPNIKNFMQTEHNLFKKMLSNPAEDPGDYFDLLDEDMKKKYALSRGAFRGLYAGPTRNQTVSAVAPLGLKLFGSLAWFDIAPFSIDVLKSFDIRLVYKLAHLNHIYNSSKIAINISHSQNITGYPWRVLDIMASGACLVSDFKSDLAKDFKGKVDIPFYETPFDAYQLCKNLLKDEQRRKEIVEQANEAVLNGYLWEQRIKQISEICGVTLENKNTLGHFSVLDPRDYYSAFVSFSNKLTIMAAKSMPKKLVNFVLKTNKILPISMLLPLSVKTEIYHILLACKMIPKTDCDLPVYEIEHS